MNSETIASVKTMLIRIETSTICARDELAAENQPGALQQLEEIQGWANAAVEALATVSKPEGSPS